LRFARLARITVWNESTTTVTNKKHPAMVATIRMYERDSARFPGHPTIQRATQRRQLPQSPAAVGHRSVSARLRALCASALSFFRQCENESRFYSRSIRLQFSASAESRKQEHPKPNQKNPEAWMNHRNE
jgi:hypothetical protein